jgi:hypothetical protein
VNDSWYPVRFDEMKAYYALRILMAQIRSGPKRGLGPKTFDDKTLKSKRITEPN